MNPVNRVVLSRREFPNKDDLYAAVAQQIRVLLESGYILVANKQDEMGDSICIDYSIYHTDMDWPRPFWLVENEMMAAANEHIDNEVSNANQIISSADRANAVVDALLRKNKKNNGGNNDGGFDA